MLPLLPQAATAAAAAARMRDTATGAAVDARISFFSYGGLARQRAQERRILRLACTRISGFRKRDCVHFGVRNSGTITGEGSAERRSAVTLAAQRTLHQPRHRLAGGGAAMDDQVHDLGDRGGHA